MASPLTQQILGQLSQAPPAPKPQGASNVDIMGLAKALMLATPTGQYDPNGQYNQLGGKPGGYSSIDDLLGNATRAPGMFGMGR